MGILFDTEGDREEGAGKTEKILIQREINSLSKCILFRFQ